MQVNRFRNSFAEDTFRRKYAQGANDSWDALAERLVEDVCGSRWGTLQPLMSKEDRDQLTQYIKEMKFLAGGRYLYYAGRPYKAFNNCYLLRAEEDTREEWSNVTWRAMSCLMTGGGIGIDYSRLRPSGKTLSRTGGIASGPIPLMKAVNSVAQNVMQGGSRRSAVYASLHHSHEDIPEFLVAKDWHNQPAGTTGVTLWDLKQQDFNFPAPLDMTNISVNYDDSAMNSSGSLVDNPVFLQNCHQAMKTGEPGFSFNFGTKKNETLRNAPVAGDTQVLTTVGYQRVVDIVDKPVTVWTGKQWASTTFKKTKSNVPTVTVNMTGRRNITCDPTHEFFVERWSGKGRRRSLDSIDKVPASQLNNDDILHVSLPEPPKPQGLNSNMYTLGFMYGDGSFKKGGGGDFSICADSKRICEKYFDNTMFSSVLEKDGRGYARYYVTVDAVGNWRNKDQCPIEAESPSFLAGLFDADGSYDPEQNRVRLGCVNLGFLSGIQRGLESLGIMAHINKGSESGYKEGSVGWSLVVAADYIPVFAKVIPTKRLVIQPRPSYRRSVIRVESVVQGPVQDVYCCDVGVEEHAFQANGVIISNCTEVTSEDDSDVCNLGSINLGNIKDLDELKSVVVLASKFLVCGTLRADLPYAKVYQVREKNRRLGLGLMGIHEWLLKRGQGYEVTPELHKWLEVYRDESKRAADEHCDRFFISRPVAYRAIAPTGTIGILAGTTTGIEPLFAVAYKRRFLTDGTKWRYQFVVDSTAEGLIQTYSITPESIDTAYRLSHDFERRIRFQAAVQDYVDMSISSTINLPPWGSKDNNEDKVKHFAEVLAKYAPRLRGFTAYPDGARGGQPITEVDYHEAKEHRGVTYEEHDICDITGKGGSCGV